MVTVVAAVTEVTTRKPSSSIIDQKSPTDQSSRHGLDLLREDQAKWEKRVSVLRVRELIGYRVWGRGFVGFG